ncbi:PAS domain S-box protein [Sandarakinorhabdus oryzae]|uniref:PAS domain S-box protein n=1 Tax=Sandarakinorhabdus oryzae TaxID=2675220 RepID=UPI0018CC1B55|nr:PAS domain S-box protein [Sandarakinorhabdus oryzae]
MIFLVNNFTTINHLGGLLYLLVVFAAGFSGNGRLIVAATMGSIALTLVGDWMVRTGSLASWQIANSLATAATLLFSGMVVLLACRQYKALYRRERRMEAMTAALRDAQYLLQMAGKLARIGGWQFDPETGTLALTDELKVMMRLDMDRQLQGRDILERFSPDHAERLMHLVGQALRDGESFETDLPITTRSGGIVWLRVIGEAAIDGRTGHRIVQGALKDITERKRVEDEARDQQAQLHLLQTAIERVDDIVLITEADLDQPGPRIVYVNDAFERRTGFLRAEAIGQSPRILQGAKTSRRTLDHIRQCLQAGQPVRAELINYTKNGAEYWVELKIMPLSIEGGAVTHLVAIERDVTARKRQEENDRQQAQLTALSERLGKIGGWIATPANNQIIWSDGARRLMKWAAESTPSLDQTFEFYKPASRAIVDAAFRACVTQAIPFNIEVEGRTSDGSDIWARVAGTPEFDDDGRVVQVVGVVQDITEAKEMQLARAAQQQMLAERTAQLEEAQRIGSIGSWSYDFALDRLTWSRQTYTIFGIDPADFSHDFAGLQAMIHPDDRALLDQLHATARGDQRRAVTQFRVIQSNGDVRHVEQIAEPVQGQDGNVYAGTVQDVTQQVKDAQALRESEERFRLVTDVSADIIWDWDVPSGTVWWTDRAPGRFGFDLPPNITIDRWAEMMHPDDRGPMEQSLMAAMQAGDAEWSATYRAVAASGNSIDVAVLAKLVRDNEGAVVRVVGSMNDVTEQRLLEDKLRSASKLEAVGQLTGGIAHDFNNLLTVIMGNAELLEDELESQPRLQGLARMSRSAAERGSELTSRLLSFARRQPLDPRAVDIATLVSGLTPLLKRTIGADIEFATVFTAPLSPVQVDASQLENALLNLCINARDAMPDGGRILIEAQNVVLDALFCSQHADVLPGEYVLLTVTDTGVGMDSATLDKAVEPFFTTKPAGKGSGLGLSMVYGFAKQSMGHMRIYSEPGHGASVHLFLPRAAAAEPVSLPQKKAQAVGGNERILVVEDDELVLDHVSNLLTQLGYQAQCVSNGPEALAVLKSGQEFDLLFTDVMMPGGMNGRQLADAVLAIRPQMQVLYASGYAENAIVHNGQLELGVHFLHKPYRREELARKVREALASAPAARVSG